MEIEAVENAYRQQLIALAYRMTGEVAISQDIVQDLFVDWVSNPRPDIQNVPA